MACPFKRLAASEDSDFMPKLEVSPFTAPLWSAYTSRQSTRAPFYSSTPCTEWCPDSPWLWDQSVSLHRPTVKANLIIYWLSQLRWPVYSVPSGLGHCHCFHLELLRHSRWVTACRYEHSDWRFMRYLAGWNQEQSPQTSDIWAWILCWFWVVAPTLLAVSFWIHAAPCSYP